MPAAVRAGPARLLAAAALTAFSLSACGGRPATERAGGPSEPPAPTGREAASRASDAEGARPCTGAGTDVTARRVEGSPDRLLITVTNIGSTPCALYGYPVIGSGEGQGAVPPDEGTRPMAPTTLAPGDSGYAGVVPAAAEGGGSGAHPERTLSIRFFDREGGGAGPAATPSLPPGGARPTGAARVTYWLADADAARS
ncbi:hypothetical protein GCM10027168_57960 [Streptomyces capparidis]